MLNTLNVGLYALRAHRLFQSHNAQKQEKGRGTSYDIHITDIKQAYESKMLNCSCCAVFY